MLNRLKKNAPERPFGAVYALCAGMVLISSGLAGQEFILPFDDISRMQMIRDDVHRQTAVHSGMQPVYTRFIEGFDADAVVRTDTANGRTLVGRKIFEEHLVIVNKPGLRFVFDPIFNFSGGEELRRNGFPEGNPNPLYVNTRGFAVSGKVGDAVYIYTDFTENQARFPAYLTEFVQDYNVVPGMGRVKPFGEGGFDFSMASGFVGFNPSKWLTVQAGHFKHFLGHGSRSLLLSDNAFNYPFAGYTVSLWGGKVQLRNNVALMQSLERLPLGDAPESLFKRKRVSFNYLSVKPVKSLEIGLYEAVMWRAFREGSGNTPFDYSALNPLIFTNTLRFGLDDPHRNAMVGVNAAWQFIDKVRLYGQYMRDRGSDAKGGVQLGLHAYGLAEYFDVRIEYNEAEEGSYAAANALQGFTHLNQPLAHPMGSGFKEVLGALTFLRKRWYASAEWVAAELAGGVRDPLLTPGDPAAEAARVNYLDCRVAYIFNPRNQMQVFAGFTDRRTEADSGNTRNSFWYFGLKTRLPRTYRNF